MNTENSRSWEDRLWYKDWWGVWVNCRIVCKSVFWNLKIWTLKSCTYSVNHIWRYFYIRLSHEGSYLKRALWCIWFSKQNIFVTIRDTKNSKLGFCRERSGLFCREKMTFFDQLFHFNQNFHILVNNTALTSNFSYLLWSRKYFVLKIKNM